MRIHRYIAFVGSGAAVIGLSVFGLGGAAFAANGVQPVSYTMGSTGSLALDQTPTSAITLVPGTAVDMPVSTVTDTRNAGGGGTWTATVTASDLTGQTWGGTISGSAITLGGGHEGSFTSGSGTLGGTDAAPAASADTVGSVYTWTETAILAAPASSTAADTYVGTVTETVS